MKGVRVPLRVFVLEGPSVSPSALRGGTTLGTAPLVGREREVAALEDALAAAAQGQAQVVGVVGEAGVGKSRLCEEFARLAEARGITVRRASGVSHGREVPLLPVLALLRDYFGVTDADDPAAAREKVTARVLDLDPAAGENLELLLDFLEVPDPARPAPQLAPEMRMRRILEAIRRLIKRRSEQEVLVMLIEDLHWFDPQSEAFLERLIESYPGSRTLVLTNFRPEFSARWMRHSYYRQLPLGTLGGTAVGELLSALLGVDLSLAPLPGFVQESTGGNPFFVEEVVRALLEDGTLEGDAGHLRLTRPLGEVQVPPSVQAVLAARIDRLPVEHKSILQTAAVIGRTFSVAVLAGVTGSSGAALEDALSALCAAELLQETAQDTMAEFRFWHPLTQEVAYGTLLSDRRRRLHAGVAEALHEQQPDRLDELAAVLAWHWERAGRHHEAARWNLRAGGWALRSDLSEARRRWRAAVDLLAMAEDSPESHELGLRARIRLLQFGARAGIDPDEAERLEKEGRALAERVGDTWLLGALAFASGSVRFFRGDLKGGLAGYVEAARLGEGARGLKPGVLAIATPIPLGYLGPLPEALDWANRALAGCEGDPDHGAALIGYSPLAAILQRRAAVLMRMGRLAEAGADVTRAVALARPRGDVETLCWALALRPHLAWLAGEGSDALASAEEAVRLAEGAGDPSSLVLGLEALAVAHLTMGRSAEAATECERALAEARGRSSGLFEEAFLLAYLSRARLAAEDHHGADAAANEALTVARRQGAKVAECAALHVKAQLRHSSDDTALADLDAALSLVQETGALAYEPFIREEVARLRADESELRKALLLFNSIGALGHARRLEAELASKTA
ncbi:MAG: ATP-binding protein [Acidimicrobiia bacterium]